MKTGSHKLYNAMIRGKPEETERLLPCILNDGREADRVDSVAPRASDDQYKDSNLIPERWSLKYQDDGIPSLLTDVPKEHKTFQPDSITCNPLRTEGVVALNSVAFSNTDDGHPESSSTNMWIKRNALRTNALHLRNKSCHSVTRSELQGFPMQKYASSSYLGITGKDQNIEKSDQLHQAGIQADRESHLPPPNAGHFDLKYSADALAKRFRTLSCTVPAHDDKPMAIFNADADPQRAFIEITTCDRSRDHEGDTTGRLVSKVTESIERFVSTELLPSEIPHPSGINLSILKPCKVTTTIRKNTSERFIPRIVYK